MDGLQLLRKHGKNKAIRSLGRHLSRVIFKMLTNDRVSIYKYFSKYIDIPDYP